MTPDHVETITSPLTAGTDVTLVDRTPAARLVADWKAVYGLDVLEEFHGETDALRYRCNDTGLLFFRPKSLAGSSELYRGLQRVKDYYSGAPAWENHAALAAMRRGAVALEVGCGTGAFVEQARTRGIDMRGIDFNPDAVSTARAAGRPVEMRDLVSLGRDHAEQFDCLCSFQVLEHVPEPGQFLLQSVRLIKPGGTLIAAVPNSEGLLRDSYEILNYPPHHMSQWSWKAFKALEPLFGLRLVKCVPEPLASSHVALWLDTYRHQLASRWTASGVLSERAVLSLAGAILKAGARYFVPGHSMFVQFVKVGSPSQRVIEAFG